MEFNVLNLSQSDGPYNPPQFTGTTVSPDDANDKWYNSTFMAKWADRKLSWVLSARHFDENGKEFRYRDRENIEMPYVESSRMTTKQKITFYIGCFIIIIIIAIMVIELSMFYDNIRPKLFERIHPKLFALDILFSILGFITVFLVGIMVAKKI